MQLVEEAANLCVRLKDKYVISHSDGRTRILWPANDKAAKVMQHASRRLQRRFEAAK